MDFSLEEEDKDVIVSGNFGVNLNETGNLLNAGNYTAFNTFKTICLHPILAFSLAAYMPAFICALITYLQKLETLCLQRIILHPILCLHPLLTFSLATCMSASNIALI